LLKGLAKDTRVLRGGSFNNNRRNARCAYRNRNNPNNWNDNNGFRVGVVSHIFAILEFYQKSQAAMAAWARIQRWLASVLAGSTLQVDLPGK
jgi:hypothetical protein